MSPVRIDLVGRRFGRLTVVTEAPRAGRRILWECACDCGATTVHRGDDLRSGKVLSCGCLRSETASQRMRVHGQSATPLWLRWHDMIRRTTDPSRPNYHNYGGRGIAVCARWSEPNGRGFLNFAEDMGAGFRPELQIERIDNDGAYSPENCRWATDSEQRRNKRTNVCLTLYGQTKTFAEWIEVLGLTRDAIRKRLMRGWSVERALATGVDPAILDHIRACAPGWPIHRTEAS